MFVAEERLDTESHRNDNSSKKLHVGSFLLPAPDRVHFSLFTNVSELCPFFLQDIN